MTWLLVVGLAAACYAVLAWVLKVPRGGREAVGATLLVGIAGFALQGRPALNGAPKAPAESAQTDGADLVEARKQLENGDQVPGADRLLVIGDALARNGHYGDAAGVLLGAVNKEPGNADAWVALGNALVAHAEGNVTPAALQAYQKAAEADPAHPGPRFFLGLALAQSGRLNEGRALWAELLAKAPKDAPWRPDLEQRLGRLDAFIAAQNPAQTPQ